MPQRRDRTGERYGNLVVIGYSHSDQYRNGYWHCLCDCGTRTVSLGGGLTAGRIRSCGCSRMEHIRQLAESALLKHGHRRKGKTTATYQAWRGARDRCNRASHKDYADYGGRGIQMRFASVLDLIADIGEKPAVPGLSLDRIDTNGHYEAGNVRWATAKQQANNRRPRRSRT